MTVKRTAEQLSYDSRDNRVAMPYFGTLHSFLETPWTMDGTQLPR